MVPAEGGQLGDGGLLVTCAQQLADGLEPVQGLDWTRVIGDVGLDRKAMFGSGCPQSAASDGLTVK